VKTEERVRRNVLLLMIDALRADRTWGEERNCRTPVLDDLFLRSTTFRNTFSVASTTPVCTASILTGTYPFVHGIRSMPGRPLRPDIPTLAETFKAGGYHTWAEVTGPLEPVTRLDRGFDDYRLRDHTEWLDTSFGERLLTRLRENGSAPWFGFLHLWELHTPRRVAPDFDRPEYGKIAYDRALSSLDPQLGRLLDALPDETVVVLTGDHGEYVSESGERLVKRLKRSFRWIKKRAPVTKKLKRATPIAFRTVGRVVQRRDDLLFNWLEHGFHVYDEVVHVPLVMYGSGLFPGGRDCAQLASHVDILPTLVSALDLPKPRAPLASGLDLMPYVQGRGNGLQDRVVYMEESGGRRLTRAPAERWEQRFAAVRTDRYKYVHGLFGERELYDLESDPGERRDVSGKFPDVAESMRARLFELTESSAGAGLEEEPSYSSEERALVEERLRDLGYLD
jgi:arylsulfatase A-like enzyme